MKKIILGMAALALVLTTACHKNVGSADGMPAEGQLKTFGDSLAYFMGYAQGGMIASRIQQNMPEEDFAKFNKNEFLKGLKSVLKIDTARVDYLSGVSFGLNLFGELHFYGQEGVDVDNEELFKAFEMAFTSDSLDHKSLQFIVGQYQLLQNKVRELQQIRMDEARNAQRETAAQENMAKGKEFVDNAKKEDPAIKTTESGLSYKVVKQGNGPKPTANDKVRVKYTGKLIDGRTFDSTDNRGGEPAEFALGDVIPGFREGLEMMNKGSEYVLYIPANLGYGNNETGSITPGSTLIFTIEMIDVIPAK